MDSAIEKLSFLLDDQECQHFLDLALQTCLYEFCEEHGVETLGDVAAILGEDNFVPVYTCVLDFFFSNSYINNEGEEPLPWNMIDVFFQTKKAPKLTKAEKAYLKAMQKSYLSLYEVVEVEEGKRLCLHDIIEDRPPVWVSDEALSEFIEKKDIIAARLLNVGDTIELAPGCFPLDPAVAKETAEGINILSEMTQTMLGMEAANDEELQMHSEDERQRLMRVMWAPEIMLAYMTEVEESCKQSGHSLH